MEEVKEISLTELNLLLKEQGTVMVDVRENDEYSNQNIGGMNIPAHEIPDFIPKLSAYKNIVIVCSNGLRSSIMARVIHKKIPVANIYHLTEGIFQ